MKQIFRLLKLASAYKWWMLLAALLGFFTVGSGIGLLMTSAYIISKAALHPSVAELQVGIVGVRFFGISRGLFRYLERLVSHDTTFRMLSKFRVWFYKALEPLAPARLQKYRSGDLLNRIISDVQTLEYFYVRVIAPPLVAIGISILMFVLLGTYSVLFSLILLFFHLTAGIGVPVLSYLYSKNIGGKILLKRAELNMLVLDLVQGISELLVFGRDEEQRKEIMRVNAELENLNQKMARISAMHESLIGLLMNGAVAALLMLAVPMVVRGVLDGVYLAVISLGIMASFEALLPLPETIQFMEKNVRAAQRLFEIIDAPPEISDRPNVENCPPQFELEIRNLSFKYESTVVLDDICMRFPPGSKTAVVGPSGAGKSTLIQLLLRFWEYEEGEILLGGKELHTLAQDAVRQQMAVVSQKTYLFNESLKENLLLADQSANIRKITEAAKKAQIHDSIMRLENNYNASAGDQGMQFSGGQRQRLAIARALLKKAPILLLDEAAANLDALTEQKILQTILQTNNEKTVIHITHRLTALERFDRIYVLDGGRVVQEGNHKRLAAQPGLYRQMLHLQQNLLNHLE